MRLFPITQILHNTRSYHNIVDTPTRTRILQSGSGIGKWDGTNAPGTQPPLCFPVAASGRPALLSGIAPRTALFIGQGRFVPCRLDLQERTVLSLIVSPITTSCQGFPLSLQPIVLFDDLVPNLELDGSRFMDASILQKGLFLFVSLTCVFVCLSSDKLRGGRPYGHHISLEPQMKAKSLQEVQNELKQKSNQGDQDNFP